MSNWANVSSPHYTFVDSVALTNYSSSDVWHAFDHVLVVPTNSTFLRSPTTMAIYRVAGGAPLYISSCTPIGGCGTAAPVDAWAIADAGGAGVHLAAAPANGTVVEGMPSHHYWLFENGKRSTTTTHSNTVIVDDASLSPYPTD